MIDYYIYPDMESYWNISNVPINPEMVNKIYDLYGGKDTFEKNYLAAKSRAKWTPITEADIKDGEELNTLYQKTNAEAKRFGLLGPNISNKIHRDPIDDYRIDYFESGNPDEMRIGQTKIVPNKKNQKAKMDEINALRKNSAINEELAKIYGSSGDDWKKLLKTDKVYRQFSDPSKFKYNPDLFYTPMDAARDALKDTGPRWRNRSMIEAASTLSDLDQTPDYKKHTILKPHLTSKGRLNYMNQLIDEHKDRFPKYKMSSVPEGYDKEFARTLKRDLDSVKQGYLPWVYEYMNLTDGALADEKGRRLVDVDQKGNITLYRTSKDFEKDKEDILNDLDVYSAVSAIRNSTHNLDMSESNAHATGKKALDQARARNEYQRTYDKLRKDYFTKYGGLENYEKLVSKCLDDLSYDLYDPGSKSLAEIKADQYEDLPDWSDRPSLTVNLTPGIRDEWEYREDKSEKYRRSPLDTDRKRVAEVINYNRRYVAAANALNKLLNTTSEDYSVRSDKRPIYVNTQYSPIDEAERQSEGIPRDKYELFKDPAMNPLNLSGFISKEYGSYNRRAHRMPDDYFKDETTENLEKMAKDLNHRLHRYGTTDDESYTYDDVRDRRKDESESDYRDYLSAKIVSDNAEISSINHDHFINPNPEYPSERKDWLVAAGIDQNKEVLHPLVSKSGKPITSKREWDREVSKSIQGLASSILKDRIREYNKVILDTKDTEDESRETILRKYRKGLEEDKDPWELQD